MQVQQVQQQQAQSQEQRPTIGSFLIDYYHNKNNNVIVDDDDCNDEYSDQDDHENDSKRHEHVVPSTCQQQLPSLLRDILLRTSHSNDVGNNNSQRFILLYGKGNSESEMAKTAAVSTSLLFDLAISLSFASRSVCRCGNNNTRTKRKHNVSNYRYSKDDDNANTNNDHYDEEYPSKKAKNMIQNCSCVSVVVFRFSSSSSSASSSSSVSSRLPTFPILCHPVDDDHQQNQQENVSPHSISMATKEAYNRIQIIYVESIFDIVHYLLSIASLPYHRHPIHGIFIEQLDHIIKMPQEDEAEQNKMDDEVEGRQQYDEQPGTRNVQSEQMATKNSRTATPTTSVVRMTHTVAILFDTITYFSKIHKCPPPPVLITMRGGCNDNDIFNNDGRQPQQSPQLQPSSYHPFHQYSSIWSPLIMQLVPFAPLSTATTANEKDHNVQQNNSSINDFNSNDNESNTEHNAVAGQYYLQQSFLDSKVSCIRTLATITLLRNQELEEHIIWKREFQ